MGAKTKMLIYANGNPRDVLRRLPELDREASQRFAAALFPDDYLIPIDDGSLCDSNPPENEIVIGCFPGVSIVAAREFGIDYPSRLPTNFLEAGGNGDLYLHVMHSVVDWFAFAWWENGTLRRSLSLSHESGVLEDVGERLPFEIPYWQGLHPAFDEADEELGLLPFHPLELAEAALNEFLGCQIEGAIDDSHIDLDAIPLMQFKRVKRRSLWKPW